MAVVIPTVVDALSVFYSVITATLFIPIAAALVTTRGGQVECLAAMGAGLVAWVVAAFVYPSIAMGVPSPAFGLLASAAAFGATLVRRGAR
jgi:hypothetical protein